MPRSDLDWAIRQFCGSRMSQIVLTNDYYNGDHSLRFATAKYQGIFGRLFQALADNLCPTVVDAVADRLQVQGFTSSEAVATVQKLQAVEAPTPSIGAPPGGVSPAPAPDRFHAVTDDPLAAAAWDLWERRELDLIAGQVHCEVIKNGEAYVLCWLDRYGEITLYPQCAYEMAVQTDPDDEWVVTLAAKWWWDEATELIRLNLYYADHIEKYVTTKKFKGDLTYGTKNVDAVKPDQFDSFAPDVPNPWGIVPVWKFCNKVQSRKGSSELDDVIPLQDALNKTICDLMVSMEFNSYRQRWATGIDVPQDEDTGRPTETPFNPGVDRMFTAPDADTRFGEFAQSDLTQLVGVADSFRSEVARVSGTPLHYFFITKADYPSGEALKSSEVRFEKKVRDRQISFDKIWEKIMLFALAVDGSAPPEYVSGYVPESQAIDLNVEWAEETSRSENEQVDVATKKKALGVSLTQIFKELGYDDDQITAMLQESQSNALVDFERQQALAIQSAQNAQSASPPGPAGASQGARQ